MSSYYTEVERVLGIPGPVRYPWWPKRPPYPYRAHEVNGSGLALARGFEALRIPRSPTPLATLSAPWGDAHQCVCRGCCVTGCSTNAKQSTLVVCDGSSFPTVGGVNSSLTIQAIACGTADRIRELSRQGNL